MAPLALLLVTLPAVVVVPASAQRPDVPPPREYGETGVQTGVVTVRARSDWLPAGSAGSGSSSSCERLSVEVVIEDDFVQPVNRQWRSFASDGSIPFTATHDLPSDLPMYLRHFSPTGRWYLVSCDGSLTVVPEGGPAVNVAGLLQQALDQVDPPDPDLAMTPETLHYTQLQSWLAIDPAYWNADRRATAAAGRVVVTAIVRPVEAEWDMGDGETVVCPGPGTVWQPGADPGSATCAHTYRRTSVGAPGDAFEVTTTVRFAIEVQTNAPGSYGPFELERSVTESIQVGEIQAVND